MRGSLWMPFSPRMSIEGQSVSHVSIVPSVFGMEENIPVSITIGGDKVGLRIVATPTSKNISLNTTGLHHETDIKLNNGTQGIYGSQGDSSMLIWAQDGVEYTLSSSNSNHKPDLSEQELVQVAESFR